jgi:hypothetical protein
VHSVANGEGDVVISEKFDIQIPQIPQSLLEGHHFISYSALDGQDFALKLHDALSAQKDMPVRAIASIM